MNPEFPVILGAGPAGLSASNRLSQLGIHHYLIEKTEFPKDKICGDALSGKVLNQLKRQFPLIYEELLTSKEANPSHGISFFSPNGTRTDIPFRKPDDLRMEPPGFILSRLNFDYLLFKHLDKRYTHILYADVDDIIINEKGVELFKKNGELICTGNLLISAEGSRMLAAKKYAHFKKENNHYCAGLRQYMSGVKDLNEKGFIELHFIDHILPGYFWIFPMRDGMANVGMGMLTSEISKRNINLTKEFQNIIQTHPALKERFSSAEPLEIPKGWSLPLGSKKRKLSGNRFILTGDAASLIDPFTGEGIANAIISGIKAAEYTQKAITNNDFSSAYLKQYDEELYNKIWQELKLSAGLQSISHIKPLFNWIVNKANTNSYFKNTLIDMFNHTDLRKQLFNPIFYFRLLWG